MSLLLIGSAVAGCTTASTTMLSDNTARISARDLSTGSRSQVRKKALITAAQEARARGYEYFSVLKLNEWSRQEWITTSGRLGDGGGGPAPPIPSRDLFADLTVRFLRADELPAHRDGIYSATEVSTGKLPTD